MYIVKFVMLFCLGFSCVDFHFLLYFDSHLSLVSCSVLLPPSCLDCHHQLFPAVSASLVSGHCLPVYILPQSSACPLLRCTFPLCFPWAPCTSDFIPQFCFCFCLFLCFLFYFFRQINVLLVVFEPCLAASCIQVQAFCTPQT